MTVTEERVDREETSKSYPDTLKGLSEFIFTSKYARYLEEEQRRETWEEAVSRVEDMHLRRFSDQLAPAQLDEIRWAFDLVRQKKVAPSMRSMQFAGQAVEDVELRGYNCSVRHIDSIRSFAEVFYLLLCGCGVGVGLTRKYLDRLPDLVGPGDKTGTVLTYVVEDNIAGWADSIEALLSCYFKNTPFSGRKIVFDYSKIRPEGAPLKTSGGKAPGYKGLKRSLMLIKELLDHLIEEGGETRMRSIDAYDILMHVSDAVLSGGIRRSAMSVDFDKDDELMLNAKTGNWYEENPQRGRSNNSAMLVRDEVTLDEFRNIVRTCKEWGEPGFVFVNNKDVLLNPCREIGFVPVTDDGVCGVQVCNLTSINGALVSSAEDYFECAKAAAIIGTLQASYTNFDYLSPAARHLTEEEALLGVSTTGKFENPEVLLDPDNEERAARLAVDTNERWAKLTGINPAARVTAIKPEGTWSLVSQTMCSGEHPAHARWMFRRVQINRLENPYQFFKNFNPQMCEPSVWSSNNTDDSITWPVKVPDEAILKGDLTAIEHLEIIKSTQKHWVLSGTTPHNKKDVTHNVSCTVVVQDHEWDEVTEYLYRNRDYFAAVSLVSASSDKDYQQAPNEAVATDEDWEKFYALMDAYVPVDFTFMTETEDDTRHSEEIACAGGACELV